MSRSPAVAGYEGEEGDARGNITRVADAATALVGGVVNIARVAAVGRQNGFRAGRSTISCIYFWDCQGIPKLLIALCHAVPIAHRKESPVTKILLLSAPAKPW